MNSTNGRAIWHRRILALTATVGLLSTFFVGGNAVASPAPAAGTVRLILQTKSGLSVAAQHAVVSRLGGTLVREIGALRTGVVDLPAGQAAAVLKRYQADPAVRHAELDHSRIVSTVASDPAYADQWSLPKIGWDQVHGVVTPAGSATIAVLDTGIDGALPDLAGRLVPGYSAFGTDPAADPNGHGTSIASIAAANTDNDTGIAGVAYSGVTVMPVQVIGADGTGQDSDIISGVTWAADNGADVILMAFSNPTYSQALQDAISYAWSKGAVIVAATGNGGSTAVSYPAGAADVVGVSATDQNDALWSASNSGEDTFLGAPGVGIVADAVGGGTQSVTGTSASAAIVAGAAALVKANDAAASNAVVVGRLGRTADAAGTVSDTGNGRVNLTRAIADTSTTGVTPAGAVAPSTGGPFVGPYVVAANVSGTIQGQNNPPCVSPSPCPWQTANLTGWSELQDVPLRLLLGSGQSSASTTSFTIDIDHAAGSSQGLESLKNFAPTSNVTMGPITFTKSTIGSGAETYSYTFTVKMTDALAGEIDFNTRLLAGAHNFTGNSLQIKGAGTLSFVKPTAAPGSPDLVLTKSALTAVSPGQTLTYTLAYRNAATGSLNAATGVLITDALPSQVTYVPGSCSGCTYDPLAKTLSWQFASVAAGAATATKTYQVTVDPALTSGTQFTNDAKILSAENDANVADNYSKVTTTAYLPSISGIALDDVNGDGLDNDGGLGLAGAGISLFIDTNGNGVYNAGTDLQVGSTITTGSTGEWTFANITALVKGGTYFVVRTNPAGYTSTQAIPGTGTSSTAAKVSNDQIKVVLQNVANTYSLANEFLARQSTGSLSGAVYNDLNGNGAFDAGETGISGVTVTRSGTGTLTTATAADGSYSFSGLPAGAYSISYATPTGFADTSPTNPLSVTVASGGSATGKNFFAQERDASISGTVYNDLNGNGAFDTGEPGLSGVTVSRGTATTTTNASGGYSFTGLAAGSYSIDYTLPIGFANTGSKPLSLTLTAGQVAVSKNLFARQSNATISGTMYDDADGSTGLSAADSGKGGVTVFIDANGNGTMDTGETSTTSSAVAGSVGNYSLTGLTTGTYAVTYILPGGYANTGTRPQSVSVAAGSAATGNNFFARRTTTTVLTLTTGSSPSVYGSSLTFTATVTSAAGNPSSLGTVSFYDGVTPVCTAVALSLTTATCSTSSLNVGAGAHSLTAAYSGTTTNPGWSGSTSAPLSQTVTAKALTITAANRSKTYGTVVTFAGTEFSTSGLTNTDTVSSVSLSSTGAPATATVAGSTYPIVASAATGTGLANYTISYVDGALTVTAKALTITATNKSKVYGDANPTLTASYVGLVNGDTSAVVNGLVLDTTTSTISIVGTYPITVTGGTAANYAITRVNGTLTVTPKTTAVTLAVAPTAVQYSDQVTLTANVSPTLIAGSQLTGSVMFAIVGEPAIAPVAIDAGGNASVIVTLTGQVTPIGSLSLVKAVMATFASTNANFAGATATGSVTENLESAAITYTGDGLKVTASASATTATVNLAAAVQEDPDGFLGTKLNTTMLRFTVYKFTDTAMATAVSTCTTLALSATAILGTDTGACSLLLTVDNYMVKIELLGNGYYTAPVEVEAVTVAVPGTGFTTGGGWITEPTLKTKSNFGFTTKYLKNGNIQGNSLYIYRKSLGLNQIANPSGGYLPAGDYNWIIKSNAMTQLTQSCTPTAPNVCTSTFTGKANITAVNRATGVAYSLGGNMQFQVDVTDNGEPGSSSSTTPDRYAVRVWDITGTYYQLGTPTAQLSINGGNIQVKP